jgi:hypothetical protein
MTLLRVKALMYLYQTSTGPTWSPPPGVAPVIIHKYETE